MDYVQRDVAKACLVPLMVLALSDGMGQETKKQSLREIVPARQIEPLPHVEGEHFGRFTPYALAYATATGIDTGRIMRINSSQIIQEEGELVPRLISSYRYDRTQVRSQTVLVYELLILEVRDNAREQQYVAILHNYRTPDFNQTQNKEWRLSILGNQGSVTTFNLDSLSGNWMWPNRKEYVGGDMTYTDLRVVRGVLAAVVTHSVSGTGHFPEQGYSFFFDPAEGGVVCVRVLRIDEGRERTWLE